VHAAGELKDPVNALANDALERVAASAPSPTRLSSARAPHAPSTPPSMGDELTRHRRYSIMCIDLHSHISSQDGLSNLEGMPAA
jgi:hypothetical protein